MIATRWHTFSTSSSRWAGEEDGPAFAGPGGDHLPKPCDAGRVEPVHRLVEDQQLRIAEQGSGDAEPLAHAEAVAADRLPATIAQADEIQ